MTGRPLLALATAAFALAGGCTEDTDPPGPPTPEQVQRCLSERKDVVSVQSVPPGRPDIVSLTSVQEHILEDALRPSRAALDAHSGGPATTDGGIAEAAARATELHFFADAAAARDAAETIAPVVGSPDESVLNGVQALGSVLVLHYSFSIGDRPGGVGIDKDLTAVEACLRDTGYLAS